MAREGFSSQIPKVVRAVVRCTSIKIVPDEREETRFGIKCNNKKINEYSIP